MIAPPKENGCLDPASLLIAVSEDDDIYIYIMCKSEQAYQSSTVPAEQNATTAPTTTCEALYQFCLLAIACLAQDWSALFISEGGGFWKVEFP